LETGDDTGHTTVPDLKCVGWGDDTDADAASGDGGDGRIASSGAVGAGTEENASDIDRVCCRIRKRDVGTDDDVVGAYIVCGERRPYFISKEIGVRGVGCVGSCILSYEVSI
jgi:hypothetical protein